MLLVPTNEYDEWMSYELLPTRYVNISMCFAAFDFVDANVSMATVTTLSGLKENCVIPELNGLNTKLC